MPQTLAFMRPGTPERRGAWRYLWWLVVSQWQRALLVVVLSVVWMITMTLPPYFIAKAIDRGLRAHDLAALCWWSAGIVGIGALTAGIGLARHRTMTLLRIDAAYRTVASVLRHAIRLGATFPALVSSGEVVSIGGADLSAISEAQTVVGPGLAAVVSYAVVAVLLLGISPSLALVALLGVPVIGILVGPLLGRLRRTKTEYRVRQGALTTRAGDIVAGLRVLCGIGGKPLFAERYRAASDELRAEGYRVGAVMSWIEALSVGLPSVFLATITLLAARLTALGEITVGQFVAVYGYVAVLIIPVGFLIESIGQLSGGLVAARRVIRVLNLEPSLVDGDGGGPAGPARLSDPDSGFRLEPGRSTALVCARSADAAALVDRLARYVDSPVSWGNRPLAEVSLAEVRRRILVADNDAYLFDGTVREAVGVEPPRTDASIVAAMHLAAADDILAGLPAALDAGVQVGAANFSGGQQQRLRLVRALLADPEVLILVEPTSAVDAHTEALIAERVGTAREGRTTLVVATSPLLLERVDEVAFLADGRVAAQGSHRDLLHERADYRALVFRGNGDDTDD